MVKEKKQIKEERYTIKRPYELDKYPEALLGPAEEQPAEEETTVIKTEGGVETKRETVKREYEADKFEDLVKSPEDNIFYRRAKKYWDEMYGMMEILNWANPKLKITSPDSPHITHFLLWRLLSETKGVKAIEQRLHTAIKELKLNFGVFTEGG